MPCRASHRQVGEDFTDDRGELESVSGEAAGHGTGRDARMRPDDEVLVGGHGVKAGFCTHKLTLDRGDARLERVDNSLDVSVVDRAIDGLGRALNLAAVNRDLDSAQRPVDRRKAVRGVAAGSILGDEDRKTLGRNRSMPSLG